MNFGRRLEESLSSGDWGDICLDLEDFASSCYAKYPYFAAINDIITNGKPTTEISLPFPFNIVNSLLLGIPTNSRSSAFFANEYTQSPQLYKGLLKVPDGIDILESWSNQYHNTILFGLLALEDEYSVEAINCWGNKQQLIESCIFPNYLLNIGGGGSVNNANGQNQQQLQLQSIPPPPPLPTDVQFTSNDTVRILHSMLPMLKKKQCPLYHLSCGISDSNSNVFGNIFAIENNKDIAEEYFVVGQIIKMIIFERMPLPLTNDQLIEHHFTKHHSLTSSIVMFTCSLRVGFGGVDGSSFTSAETIETIAIFALIQCNLPNATMELAPLSLGIISSYSTECSGHSARSLLKRIIDDDGHSSCVKFSAAKGYAFSLLLSDCTHLFDLSTTTTLEGLLAYVMINERPSENGCNFYQKQRSLEERILVSLIDGETANNHPALAYVRDSFRIFSTAVDDVGDWSCCIDLLKDCSSSNTATKLTFDSKINDVETHCLRWFLLLGMAIRLHVNPSLVELESVLIKEIGPLTKAFSAPFKGLSGHIRALIMALLTSATPETPVEPKIRWALLIACIFPFEQLSSPIGFSSIKEAHTSSINWSMIMFDFVIEKKKRYSFMKISPKVKSALFDCLKNLTGLTGDLLEYLVEE